MHNLLILTVVKLIPTGDLPGPTLVYPITFTVYVVPSRRSLILKFITFWFSSRAVSFVMTHVSFGGPKRV